MPTLRPGDIVIIDNPPAHPHNLLSATPSKPPMRDCSTFRLTPRLFNPIEKRLRQIKAFLRKVAARTINDLWDANRQVLPLSTPDECPNYLTAGYEPE